MRRPPQLVEGLHYRGPSVATLVLDAHFVFIRFEYLFFELGFTVHPDVGIRPQLSLVTVCIAFVTQIRLLKGACHLVDAQEICNVHPIEGLGHAAYIDRV